jgi:hypothetical protein
MRRGSRSGYRFVNIAASVKMFEGVEFERGSFGENADPDGKGNTGIQYLASPEIFR